MAAVVVLTLAACTRGGYHGPEGLQPLPTTVEDTFAVPDVIDAAYVNRVLAELNRIDGDFNRLLVKTHTVEPKARALLRAIFNDPALDDEMRSLETLDYGNFKRPPGNRRTTVTEVVTGRPTCILAKVTYDFSAVAVATGSYPGEVDIVTLRPKQEGADPHGKNPTPWAFSHLEQIGADETPPDEARCDAHG